jgi:serine/threonine protein kinase
MLQPLIALSSALHYCRQLSIITDYIPGWNLAELTETCLKKTGAPLPEAAIAGIAGQLMRALVLLHSNQVIHRDIKPTSILIQRDGLVCITGLGNAHLSSRDSFSGAGAPHGNSMVGTPWYFAPERIMGMAFGASVDLYSTGFVLVEAALGRYPYASIQTQIVKLFETIMSGPSVADMLPPTYSDQCKAFLTICTHANRCPYPPHASFFDFHLPSLPYNLSNLPSKNRSGALQMLRHPWLSGAQGLPALQKPVKDLLDRLV